MPKLPEPLEIFAQTLKKGRYIMLADDDDLNILFFTRYEYGYFKGNFATRLDAQLKVNALTEEECKKRVDNFREKIEK